MPTVYIWSPDNSHKYGHAALKTNKYHVSFWPDGDVKEELGTLTTAVVGVKGCLVFHQELDRFYEGNRLPTGTYEIANATNEAINRIHENFLRYNGVDPEEVTLEAAEELVKNGEKPEISVSRTPYTFIAEVEKTTLVDAEWLFSSPFYHFKQSCVSFCFNIINKAHQIRFPICIMPPSSSFDPMEIPEDLIRILLPSFNGGIFTVPWFEEYVVQHWMPESRPNRCLII